MNRHIATNTVTVDMPVHIHVGKVVLEGNLNLPEGAHGVVLFAHGSGSNRHSPRNQFVARVVRSAGIGSLLLDLLTDHEQQLDAASQARRIDLGLQAGRIVGATRWLEQQPETCALKVGYFGASTGGGAALVAAAELGDQISAVVLKGGRPDLAAAALPKVKCPTLLIVGGLDEVVIAFNESAFAQLRCGKDLRIVSGASNLFDEPGKLEEVAQISLDWFYKHLNQDPESCFP